MHRASTPLVAESDLGLSLQELDPPIPMTLLARGFIVRWISSLGCRQLGLTREQVEGRCWYDLFPQSRARAREHDALFTGELERVDVEEFETVCGDTRRYFFLRMRPVRSPDGTVCAVMAVAEDITSRVLAERELRRNEERFRAIWSETRDAVVICDARGTVLFTNPAVERILGRGNMEGASAFRLMHPDDLPRAQDMFARLVADVRVGVMHDLEIRKQHADGTWRWLEITGSNLLDHPSVRGIVLHARDCTRRKIAEADAAAARTHFETALWGSKAAYWRVTVDDDHAEMSPNFWSLFGIDRAEWERDAHPWNARLHPDDRARVQRVWDDCLAGRVEFYEIEYRLRTAVGWLWLHDRARITERHEDGRPRAVCGTSQDATARKTLESAFAEAVAAEHRRLGYDLHDGLGQELTGVQFLLASVANRLRSVRPEEAAVLEDAQALVRGAIDTTRAIAQGLGAPGLRHGDLRLAIEELAADVSRRHGLQVECRTSGWTRDTVSDSAAQQIYRIVQEAVTNARRHAEATRVGIALHASGHRVEVSVADDGCGLPATAVGAQGMGLTIMAERARSIGAEFTIGTDAGGGTRVVVSLPVRGGVAHDLAAP